MPCYSPLHGYKSKLTTANGRRAITFNRSAGFTDVALTVPCGVCIGCRIDRSREWAIRCVHEAKTHARSCFITLTYDDDHLPVNKSLDKTHLQKFFKRLRKKCGPFRYFASGEYGDKTERPHYHAIIFGLDFSEDRKRHSYNKQKQPIYKSQTLTETWGLGHCTIGAFSYQTAAYTARYVMKKRVGKHADDHYTRVDLSSGDIYNINPEFACMSLKPGIGSDWYDKFKKDAFPSDFLIVDGKKHPVPRYYADKLKKEDETLHKKIKIKRKLAQKLAAYHSTSWRLRTREECKKAQISRLTRSL